MIYAFIPARSGSTRLKDKNIKNLEGKPLIAWTLEAAMQSDGIDKIIFSTDSQEYAEIAKRICETSSKPLIIDIRSQRDASAKSKIFDYLKNDLLEKFALESDDIVVQLLPTCPLRQPHHIDDAISLMSETGKGVFAACEYDFHVSFAFQHQQNGEWQPLFDNSPMLTGNTQSQDQITYYHTNGSINVLPVSLLRENRPSIYYGCVAYLMPSQYSVDIDGEEDFVLAGAMLKLLRKPDA
ncbi:cytidylyltransferase domain-containing protein [Aestuariibacter salexigens]|uniref:acylneuraminate cytidylyltransferase family protein n=1 Tax=Aestuariibacter salexigens TaxID=226010 RepID=UPI0004048C8A|nr:acylneuraminate cytidylyltransferase family protein [Aestuariibacter salexigens]